MSSRGASNNREETSHHYTVLLHTFMLACADLNREYTSFRGAGGILTLPQGAPLFLGSLGSYLIDAC